MRNLGIKDFFLIWRKNTLNVDLGGGGKHIFNTYIYRLVGAIPIVAGGFQCAAQSTLAPNKYGLSKGHLADYCPCKQLC